MSYDRLNVPDRPHGKIQLTIRQMIEAAVLKERLRCADIAVQYPLDGFCYDTNNQGEILRLRDTISEAILKDVPAGEMIR